MSNRDICLCGQMFSAHNTNFCITAVNRNEDEMKTFKMIGNLGIDLLYAYQCDRKDTVIYAEDLEALLQSAQVVYEVEDSAGINSWLHIEAIGAKSKALLIGITPIKKQTKAEAALEFLQMFVEQKTTWHSQAAWEEAKRILEMKDEV